MFLLWQMDFRDMASGLIALLFIVAVGYYLLQPPAGQKPMPSPSPLLSSPTPLPSPANLQLECDKNLAKAFNASDSGECYGISCPQTREYCLGVLNRNEGKKSFCLAGISFNASHCLGIAFIPSRDACLSQIAFETGNASICNSIEDGKTKDGCMTRTK